MRQGLDDIVYINGQDVSTNFKKARTDIRRIVEDTIEEAAKAKDPEAGALYGELKSKYQKSAENYDFVDDFFNILPEGTTAYKAATKDKQGLALVRNLQGDDKRKFAEAVADFGANNPQYADDVEGLLNSTLGAEWAKLMPSGKMDISRGMQGLVAGAASTAGYAIPTAIGYGVTRPKIAKTYLPAIASTAKATGRVVKDAAEGLATPMGEQVSREAVRVALPEIGGNQTPVTSTDLPAIGGKKTATKSELPAIGSRPNIEGAIIDNAPKIVDFAKNRYGANFKRALDAGMDETTAAFTTVNEQLNKGNTNVMAAFEGISTDPQAVTRTLNKYTGQR